MMKKIALFIICMILAVDSFADDNKDAAKHNKDTPDKIQAFFRTGFQTSTLNPTNGETATTDDNRLFQDNHLFFDITAQFNVIKKQVKPPAQVNQEPQVKEVQVDLVAGIRLGRKSVEGETINNNQSLEKIVKDAEVAEGSLAAVIRPFDNELESIYLKPQLGFILTSDSRLENDFLSDSFIGIGFSPDSNTFKGSAIELGYGYSERFDNKHRFKGSVELRYNNNSEVTPFITARWDAGRGPDDLIIYYGVYLNINNVFEEIVETFTPSPTEQPQPNTML
ncbi:MAG: hypothetical protein HZC49_11985 [Nitrospirae bacterium]|nr:hypothetical protein [Nitrospirota bacterium]